MVMRLVLASIVTGLLVMSSDIAALSLGPQQQQLLRHWLLRNQNVSQLRVVWQPSAAPVPETQNRPNVGKQTARWIRQPRFLAANQRVLKAGYGGQQSQPAPSPQPQPRVFVISAPTPSAPAPAAKPSQQSSYPMPAAPSSSYSMPVVQSMPSYSAPAPRSYPMPQPSSAVSQQQPSPSYRVIYIQPPAPATAAPPSVHRPPLAYRMQADTAATATGQSNAAGTTATEPSPAPSQPAQKPSSSAPANAAAAAPAAAVPAVAPVSTDGSQTLFILMPATAQAMAAVKASGAVATMTAAAAAASYALPPLPPCPPAPANFCYSKYVGHYEHPSDRACYIVCNDFGHGFTRRCARGTKWKRHGEPAGPSGYNRCA